MQFQFQGWKNSWSQNQSKRQRGKVEISCALNTLTKCMDCSRDSQENLIPAIPKLDSSQQSSVLINIDGSNLVNGNAFASDIKSRKTNLSPW